MSKTVYVINKEGKPLMPTTRNRHVRILLQQKKAKVFKRNPFTIKLLYDSPSITQDLYLGIDPGRTNIGATVIKEEGTSVYSSHLETNNKDIKDHMTTRKVYRQLRRQHKRQKRQRRSIQANTYFYNETASKNRYLPHYSKPITVNFIKNKEAKFCNRSKSLTSIPTFKHLIQTHINFIRKIFQILPITHIVIEYNKFDFQKLMNPNIKPSQYSQGTLHSFQSLKDYINKTQNNTCLLCKNPIDHYHHITNKHNNGSNNPSNIAGLCFSCHQKVHKNKNLNNQLLTLKAGHSFQFRGTSTVNICMKFIIEGLLQFQVPVALTDGVKTHNFRLRHNINKSHYNDAYCIASSLLQNQTVFYNNTQIYHYKQYRRHNRALKFQQNLDRIYYSGSKQVATNRHKSMIQIKPSLEDYISTLRSDQHLPETEISHIVSKLRVEHRPSTYYIHRKFTNGSLFKRVDTKRQKYPDILVLDKLNGSYNFGLHQESKTVKISKKRSQFLHHNSGIVLVP